jgi:rRNA maturation protein Nop10
MKATKKRSWRAVTRTVTLRRERCSCGSVAFAPHGTHRDFGVIQRYRKCRQCGVVTLFLYQ